LCPVEPEVASDYVDPSTIKVRKPKKKRTKSTRKRSADDEDALYPAASADASPPEDTNAMEVDDSATPEARPKRKFADDVSFVDDEDLQASLAIQRRAALKKRKILKPADIARQLLEEAAENGTATPGAMDEDVKEEEAGLIIDETSEFVATLRAPTVPERRAPRAPSVQPAPEAKRIKEESPEADADIDMIRDERSVSVKLETSPPPPAITSTGLEEETTISRGIGATFAMLNQRGLIKRDPEAEKKLELARQREKFLREKRLREIEAEEKAKAARAKDRQSVKFERMSAREREEHARWENKQRDVQEAREMAQRFKDYKPDVNLSYKDEFGREMNQKEVSSSPVLHSLENDADTLGGRLSNICRISSMARDPAKRRQRSDSRRLRMRRRGRQRVGWALQQTMRCQLRPRRANRPV
jgi:U4/U6.U5 tri-snRNP-associated protein 1